MNLTVLTNTIVSADDPVTAFLLHDWASLGGWSLFLAIILFAFFGFFKEWWVPGPSYKRLTDASKKQSEALEKVSSALEKQMIANEITKHFFEETTPKRKEKA